MIESKRILVITDRYPPFSEGGAEISLHLLLKPISDAGNRIHVITLSDKISKPSFRTHDGIEVTQIPYSSLWPVHLPPVILAPGKRPRRLWSKIRLIQSLTRYLLNFHQGPSIWKRLNKLRLFYSLNKIGRTGHTPLNDEDIAASIHALDLIRRTAEAFRPDIVHADNFRSILLTSQIRFDAPVIAQVRDNRFFCSHRSQATNIKGSICSNCSYGCLSSLPDRLSREVASGLREDLAFRREALKSSDRIIVTSQYLWRQISSFIEPARISIVRNPEGEAHLVPEPGTLVDASPPEILIVGMINENKGQIEVLRWLEPLARHLPDFRIIIAGRGEKTEKQLRKSIREMAYSDRVVFTGYLTRQELYRAYARASVVACPNVWPEPFGRVPLEAGISGKPVVGYAVGGISENIIHDETGFLVQPGDTESFVEYLLVLLRNPELAREMGRNAQSHIRDNFSVTASVNALSDCWEDALHLKS